jgi:hypothetical protein
MTTLTVTFHKCLIMEELGANASALPKGVFRIKVRATS